jgi:ASC-1-like (ASCH) protein
MLYEMKLNASPFTSVKLGKKTVEMRLNDEKRARIKVGDQIQFIHTETGGKLLCLVVALYQYDSFDELYRRHDKISIGYREDERATPDDMLAYYSAEKIAHYGVLGIGIEVIK